MSKMISYSKLICLFSFCIILPKLIKFGSELLLIIIIDQQTQRQTQRHTGTHTPIKIIQRIRVKKKGCRSPSAINWNLAWNVPYLHSLSVIEYINIYTSSIIQKISLECYNVKVFNSDLETGNRHKTLYHTVTSFTY